MRSVILAGATALAAGLCVVPAQPASAHLDSIVCAEGILDTHFRPGLTYSKNAVRMEATGEVSNCTSQEHPEISAGNVHVMGPLAAACPGPYGTDRTKITIDWDNGSTSVLYHSTFRSDVQTFSLEGGHVATGPVTGGTIRAHGRNVSEMVELGYDCATADGLTNQTFIIDQLFLAGI